eukprot:ctg_2956.g467
MASTRTCLPWDVIPDRSDHRERERARHRRIVGQRDVVDECGQLAQQSAKLGAGGDADQSELFTGGAAARHRTLSLSATEPVDAPRRAGGVDRVSLSAMARGCRRLGAVRALRSGRCAGGSRCRPQRRCEPRVIWRLGLSGHQSAQRSAGAEPQTGHRRRLALAPGRATRRRARHRAEEQHRQTHPLDGAGADGRRRLSQTGVRIAQQPARYQRARHSGHAGVQAAGVCQTDRCEHAQRLGSAGASGGGVLSTSGRRRAGYSVAGAATPGSAAVPTAHCVK